MKKFFVTLFNLLDSEFIVVGTGKLISVSIFMMVFDSRHWDVSTIDNS